MFDDIHRAVRRIPHGMVTTYGAVAAAAGYPGSARQVVWALRASKTPLPWHRVLGAKGRILLPGPAALDQRIRLETEGVKFQGGRVVMAEHQFNFPPRRQKR